MHIGKFEDLTKSALLLTLGMLQVQLFFKKQYVCGPDRQEGLMTLFQGKQLKYM